MPFPVRVVSHLWMLAALLAGCGEHRAASIDSADSAATAAPDSAEGGRVVPAPPPQYAIVPEIRLKVPHSVQQRDRWCWAASGEMVMASLGRDVPQCRQAADLLNGRRCCAGDPCNRRGYPRFDWYGFSLYRGGVHDLSWSEIKEHVGGRHLPIAFTWKWPGFEHMAVIVGYRDRGPDQRFVLVRDPADSSGKLAVYSFAKWKGATLDPYRQARAYVAAQPTLVTLGLEEP